MAARGAKSRGTILERIARRHGELCHPDSTFEDPDPGVDKNGKKRGKGAAKNDYNCDGARQEAKSAQLAWDKYLNLWKFEFKGIKKDLHDDLVLVFYTPAGLHIYVHDGVLGVSTAGKRTTTKGTKIQLRGPAGSPGSRRWRRSRPAPLSPGPPPPAWRGRRRPAARSAAGPRRTRRPARGPGGTPRRGRRGPRGAWACSTGRSRAAGQAAGRRAPTGRPSARRRWPGSRGTATRPTARGPSPAVDCCGCTLSSPSSTPAGPWHCA